MSHADLCNCQRPSPGSRTAARVLTRGPDADERLFDPTKRRRRNQRAPLPAPSRPPHVTARDPRTYDDEPIVGGVGLVLVVERDAALRDVLVQVLAEIGYPSRVLPDIHEVASAAASEQIAAVVAGTWGRSRGRLLDFERTQIREIAKFAPVILLSGAAWTRQLDGVAGVARKESAPVSAHGTGYDRLPSLVRTTS